MSFKTRRIPFNFVPLLYGFCDMNSNESTDTLSAQSTFSNCLMSSGTSLYMRGNDTINPNLECGRLVESAGQRSSNLTFDAPSI